MATLGDEFIQNVEITKEQMKLQEQIDSLNKKKQQTSFSSSNEEINDINISKEKNNGFDDLDNIILTNKTNNKQKYLVFGFALVLLFLITIIIIKLMQEPNTQNNFDTTNDIEEVVNDNLQTTNKKINKSLDIDKIIQSEDPIKQKDEQEKDKQKTTQDNSSDIFGIAKKPIKQVTKDTTTKIIKKNIPIEKKVIINKKQIIQKNPIKEINLEKKFKSKSIVKPTGYFIQVGAFTKQPDKRLLKTLKNNHLTYILHKMKIKGRLYTKVLVGHYKNIKDAKKDLKMVQKIVHNKYAYVLRLK